MKNTFGTIFLVGAVLSAPFAIALVIVTSDQGGSIEAHAPVEAEYEYDYPTSLWADH